MGWLEQFKSQSASNEADATLLLGTAQSVLLEQQGANVQFESVLAMLCAWIGENVLLACHPLADLRARGVRDGQPVLSEEVNVKLVGSLADMRAGGPGAGSVFRRLIEVLAPQGLEIAQVDLMGLLVFHAGQSELAKLGQVAYPETLYDLAPKTLPLKLGHDLRIRIQADHPRLLAEHPRAVMTGIRAMGEFLIGVRELLQPKRHAELVSLLIIGQSKIFPQGLLDES